MRLRFYALLAGTALLSLPALFAQAPAAGTPAAAVKLRLLPDAPAVPAAEQAALMQWLSRFQNAVYRMRIRDYLEMTDWDALIEKSYADEAVKPDASKKLLLKKTMMVISERTFPVLRPFFSFKDAEIRRLDLSGDQAVISARTHDEDGHEYKLRWWLQRHDGKWQMTDYENVTVNVRFSALLQTGFHAAQNGLKKEQATKFAQMGIALQEGQLDQAYALLKEVESNKVPAALEELFLGAKTSLLAQMEGKEAELEAALNDLEKAAPDSQVLLLLRSSASYQSGDCKNALVWLKRIGSSVGYDDDTWSMLADSHHQLGQEKEFLAASEGWAEDYPDSAAALWSLWQALPKERREARVKPLLEKIAPAEDGLAAFADEAMLEDDTGAMKLVLGVMQARKVSAELVEEYQKTLQEMLEEQKKL